MKISSSRVPRATFLHHMLDPSLLPTLDILMAQRTSISHGQGLATDAFLHFDMLVVLFVRDGFFALRTSFEVLMVRAFSQ